MNRAFTKRLMAFSIVLPGTLVSTDLVASQPIQPEAERCPWTASGSPARPPRRSGGEP